MPEGPQAERYVLSDLWSAIYHEEVSIMPISLIFRQDLPSQSCINEPSFNGSKAATEN
jgi:hypothetical protein